MIEVVFDESAKGALQCAQHFVPGGKAAIGLFFGGDRQPTPAEYEAALADARRRREEIERRGKPLGGNAKDVLGLPFQLDISDISGPATGSARRELLYEMLTANPFDELEALEENARQHWEAYAADYETLMARAAAGEPVRIWYSVAPASLCGYYDTVSLLRDCACRLTSVKLPDFTLLEDQNLRRASSWGEIEPGEFAAYLPLEAAVCPSARRAIGEEWAALKRENAPLRATINGRLHSVPADFYDGFIRGEIPDEPFHAAQLIGRVLGRHAPAVSDWLIAQRIRRMMEAGELRVVRKDKAFYQTVLERVLKPQNTPQTDENGG